MRYGLAKRASRAVDSRPPLPLAAANHPRLDVAAGFDPGTIVSIGAEVPQITYDFTGGGLYGTEAAVTSKEQADHDLRHLLAAALLDGNVLPAQFTDDRVMRPDVPHLGEIATTQQIIDTLEGRSVGLEASPAVGGPITRTSRRTENAGI